MLNLTSCHVKIVFSALLMFMNANAQPAIPPILILNIRQNLIGLSFNLASICNVVTRLLYFIFLQITIRLGIVLVGFYNFISRLFMKNMRLNEALISL